MFVEGDGIESVAKPVSEQSSLAGLSVAPVIDDTEPEKYLNQRRTETKGAQKARRLHAGTGRSQLKHLGFLLVIEQLLARLRVPIVLGRGSTSRISGPFVSGVNEAYAMCSPAN